MTKTTRHSDPARAFPAHAVQLDVAVKGADPWSVLAETQALLCSRAVELAGLTYRKNGILALRLRSLCPTELDAIDGALHASPTLSVVDWSVTIGRPTPA